MVRSRPSKSNIVDEYTNVKFKIINSFHELIDFVRIFEIFEVVLNDFNLYAIFQ